MAKGFLSHSTWYRTPNYNKKIPIEEVQRQEVAYVDWLAALKGWGETETRNYALSQRNETAVVLPFVPKAKDSVWLANDVEIRTVSCPSSTAKEFWNGEEWQRFGLRFWNGIPKSDAPTVYKVILDGRMVNSFLSMTRAKAYAHTLSASLNTKRLYAKPKEATS